MELRSSQDNSFQLSKNLISFLLFSKLLIRGQLTQMTGEKRTLFKSSSQLFVQLLSLQLWTIVIEEQLWLRTIVDWRTIIANVISFLLSLFFVLRTKSYRIAWFDSSGSELQDFAVFPAFQQRAWKKYIRKLKDSHYIFICVEVN